MSTVCRSHCFSVLVVTRNDITVEVLNWAHAPWVDLAALFICFVKSPSYVVELQVLQIGWLYGLEVNEALGLFYFCVSKVLCIIVDIDNRWRLYPNLVIFKLIFLWCITFFMKRQKKHLTSNNANSRANANMSEKNWGLATYLVSFLVHM